MLFDKTPSLTGICFYFFYFRYVKGLFYDNSYLRKYFTIKSKLYYFMFIVLLLWCWNNKYYLNVLKTSSINHLCALRYRRYFHHISIKCSIWAYLKNNFLGRSIKLLVKLGDNRNLMFISYSQKLKEMCVTCNIIRNCFKFIPSTTEENPLTSDCLLGHVKN